MGDRMAGNSLASRDTMLSAPALALNVRAWNKLWRAVNVGHNVKAPVA